MFLEVTCPARAICQVTVPHLFILESKAAMRLSAPFTNAAVKPSGGYFRNFWRVLRQLFYEITGAAFATFAVSWALSAWRDWRHGMAKWLVVLALGFTFLMTVFAVRSFLDARRIR
jgi:hypothetical protein